MNVLVVGASGFIGKNLLLRSPKRWNILGTYRSSSTFLSFLKQNELANVMPLKCDLKNSKDVKNVTSRMREIDVCVYLAANTNVRAMVDDPTIDVATNIWPLINFLKHVEGQKIVYLSSGAVYMGLEGEVSPQSRIAPTIPYAISKYTCEQYIKFHQSIRKTFERYVILRFFGAYGPYEPPRKISTKLVELLRDPQKKEFTVYGDGKNLIDFMYIEDAIKGLLAVINSEKADLTVDFCTGTPRTINELVLEVGRAFQKKMEIQHVGRSPEYITFYASPEKMSRLFGFSPNISFRDGFKMFLDWFDRPCKRT